MQDKIIVTPSEVRGLGNVVSEKELEDFLVYMSTITSTSEEVDGITRKVYALGYVPPQVSLTLTLEKTVLDYDEHTNLIATLSDENNVGIPNEEVKFYNENSYLFYTGTTDSNGVITINIYSRQPGQHTYTGVLTSDTDITGSVTVTINKITSNISLSASSSSITYGNSVTLSGTLSAGSGKSVKIYNGNSLVDTVTTGSGGAFTKLVSGLNVGSHSFTAVYDGDNVYTEVTSSVVSVNVIAPSYDDIVVSADKQILSYADSEKATLYAQLQDNGSDVAVSGVTITFKQGNTTLGTAQTDNAGKATLVDGYTSAGVGDVTITATDGVLVSKRYKICDAIDYQPMVSNIHQSRWTIPSEVSSSSTFGYSSTGWKFGNASAYTVVELNNVPQLPYSLEFYISSVNLQTNPQPILYMKNGSNWVPVFIGRGNNTSEFMGEGINQTLTGSTLVRIELKANEQKLYLNDVLITTKTKSLSSLPITFHTGSNRMIEIKDWKIKPL